MKYYSQYNQDKYLDEVIFQGRTRGLFVEVGAHDGITFSNSYFFEKERSWTGICIEPRKSAFAELVKNRNCFCENVGIAEERETKKFLDIAGDNAMLSGLCDNFSENHLKRVDREKTKEIIDVECLPLTDVMTRNGIYFIDFCGIDTEGNEIEVVKSINFEKIFVKFFLIENYCKEKELRAFMRSKGYYLIKTLTSDDLYVHTSILMGSSKLFWLAVKANTIDRLLEPILKRKYLLKKLC